MDTQPAPAKPLFLLTAVLYAGMELLLLTQADGEPPMQAESVPVSALIDSLPPSAAGPAMSAPSTAHAPADTARRDCQPLVAR